MRTVVRFSLALTVMTALSGTLGVVERAQGETLTVGAARTLKVPLQELLPIFEREYGVQVHVVYGPSKALRQQIENGEPIDVFLPTAVDEIDRLQQQGMVLTKGERAYAQTSLVMVMSATSPATAVSFRDVLTDPTIRIALGDPRVSALGEQTARALAALDPRYKSRFRLVYAKHADEIVDLVQKGKADVGIVYRADAISNARARIIDESPGGRYLPVQFGQAIVWTCRESVLDVAQQFLDFIMSTRVQKLLLHYGFDPVSDRTGVEVRSVEQ